MFIFARCICPAPERLRYLENLLLEPDIVDRLLEALGYKNILNGLHKALTNVKAQNEK